jgi:agmatine deiminase
VPTPLVRLSDYRMPPEWAPHLATYLVWPHNRETWPGKFEAVPPIFARIAAAISHFEPVRILIQDETLVPSILELINAAGGLDGEQLRTDRISFLPIPTNDSWIRDFGPTFLNRVKADTAGPMQLAINWRFNCWGGKYGDGDLDDRVPERLAAHYAFETVSTSMVLEGGSIDVNGSGLVLTTEGCLLNSSRNPSMHRQEIEENLRRYLGVERVLWLGQGVAGDDTDGHVDNLARFTANDTIVTVVEQDLADINYQVLQDNLKRLRSMRDLRGRPFKIASLPMPEPIFFNGVRLPASYANFYIVNGAVLVPAFDCPADQLAQAILHQLFPQRRIIPIPCTDLVWGLGAIHCLTLQHPSPTPLTE